ncbi:hypothetical protein HETIRDRAFT_164913 [Heterobasidion irregulare TC 32-1]|uniref:Uncharacterized protein n=1 Tax=Heterobasidion irregulare (strain TC 32-1) TaxID=747525 RepID=W4JN31_HETIT|nr:uncharacterized protein HETIRDRAFT_164913 [Heterobasidion irregulare TC 32-1]ETW74879.1 hypothetical protein HETIRDRAFT_164913 [Heterobasidion irregulare TC 32-1]
MPFSRCGTRRTRTYASLRTKFARGDGDVAGRTCCWLVLTIPAVASPERQARTTSSEAMDMINDNHKEDTRCRVRNDEWG